MQTIKIEFNAPEEAVNLFATEIAGYKTTTRTEPDEEGNVEEIDNPVTPTEHSEVYIKKWLVRQLKKAGDKVALRASQEKSDAMEQALLQANE